MQTNNMEMDYRDVKVHPLFDPIKKLFEFVIFGNGFMMMPEFQKAFLDVHPGAKSVVDDYNKEVKQTVIGKEVHVNIQTYLIHLGRLMAIGIFDFLQFSEYNKQLSQTEIFKFSKHIRNGAAHNNKFTFDPKSREVLKLSPVSWGGKTIDVSLEGKTVVPDFVSAFSLLYLMQDISKLIESKKV